MDAAFDRLRRYARNQNQRLSEVARQVVTGELDLDVVADQPVPAQDRAPR